MTRVPVVLPITIAGNFARTAGFAVRLANAGTKTTGVVRYDQPRAGSKLERPQHDRPRSAGELVPIFE